MRHYLKRRNQAKRTVKEAKRKSWEGFGNVVENNARGKNTRNFWKIIKTIGGKYGKQIQNIKDDNNSISENMAVLEVWKIYFEKSFTKLRQIFEEAQENAAGSDRIASELIKYGGMEVKATY